MAPAVKFSNILLEKIKNTIRSGTAAITELAKARSAERNIELVYLMIARDTVFNDSSCKKISGIKNCFHICTDMMMLTLKTMGLAKRIIIEKNILNSDAPST